MAMGNVHFIYTMCFIVNSGNVGSISSTLNLFFFLCLLNYSANVSMFMWKGGLCVYHTHSLGCT